MNVILVEGYPCSRVPSRPTHAGGTCGDQNTDYPASQGVVETRRAGRPARHLPWPVWLSWLLAVGVVTPLQYAAHGADAELKTSTRERLRDSLLPHRRAQDLQATDDVPNEVRKSIDRLGCLNEGVLSLFVESLRPTGYRRRPKEEAFGGLRLRPTSKLSGFGVASGA